MCFMVVYDKICTNNTCILVCLRVNGSNTPESGWIHLKVGIQCVLFSEGLVLEESVPQPTISCQSIKLFVKLIFQWLKCQVLSRHCCCHNELLCWFCRQGQTGYFDCQSQIAPGWESDVSFGLKWSWYCLLFLLFLVLDSMSDSVTKMSWRPWILGNNI